MVQQLCPVKSCLEVAAKTFLLRFNSLEIAGSAQPGQFVNILTSEVGEEPLLRRPFSISRIENDIIELLFHAVGIGTNLETGSMSLVRLASPFMEMPSMILQFLLPVESAWHRFLFSRTFC
jgi:NAD(P)H-flavin reductase